jgi:hypothetical protein
MRQRLSTFSRIADSVFVSPWARLQKPIGVRSLVWFLGNGIRHSDLHGDNSLSNRCVKFANELAGGLLLMRGWNKSRVNQESHSKLDHKILISHSFQRLYSSMEVTV